VSFAGSVAEAADRTARIGEAILGVLKTKSGAGPN
jgi:hypothetical protein